jgi:hypothetical protein
MIERRTIHVPDLQAEADRYPDGVSASPTTRAIVATPLLSAAGPIGAMFLRRTEPTPLTERQITPDHARALAETGGSIGIWHFFPSLKLSVDGLKEMVDVVGVDHVSIGTDTSSSPVLFPEYDHFTQLVDAMLRGGFTPADAAKVVGGNYLQDASPPPPGGAPDRCSCPGDPSSGPPAAR